VEFEDQDKYLDVALEIALRRIVVYDSLFVALALEEGLPLLTLDVGQRRVASSLGVKVL